MEEVDSRKDDCCGSTLSIYMKYLSMLWCLSFALPCEICEENLLNLRIGPPSMLNRCTTLGVRGGGLQPGRSEDTEDTKAERNIPQIVDNYSQDSVPKQREILPKYSS